MSHQLSRRISSLPQELQDQILLELLNIELTPGRIYLDEFGRAAADPQEPTNSRPNIAIIVALDRTRRSRAKKLLYSNTFVMPTGIEEDTFSRHWDLIALRTLPKVELRIDHESFKRDIWTPPPNRRIHRLWISPKTGQNGTLLPFPQIWSFLSCTIDNALTDNPLVGDVFYAERCDIQKPLDTRLGPMESLRHGRTYEALGCPPPKTQPETPCAQIVTFNYEDAKGMLDTLELGQNFEEVESPLTWNKEVEDQLHMAIRSVNGKWSSDKPKFRINIQLEGINHTEQQRQELWAEHADGYIY